MKIKRGYQVIDKDGAKVITVNYYEVNEEGDTIAQNMTDSFTVVDEKLQEALSVVDNYIKTKRLI